MRNNGFIGPTSSRGRGYPLKGSTPQNNNNNLAALAERFQSSMLHKLRQLGIYTDTDTPDTGHQLHGDAAVAEVA